MPNSRNLIEHTQTRHVADIFITYVMEKKKAILQGRKSSSTPITRCKSNIRVTQTTQTSILVALNGAEQLVAMVNWQRNRRQTQQEPESSIQMEKEKEESNGTEPKTQTMMLTRQEQIRLKYDELEIDDPEEWNWPE